MSRTLLAAVHNGVAGPRAAVPLLEPESFRHAILDAVADGQRVVSLFGRPDGSAVEVFVVLAADADGVLSAARTRFEEDRYPALTPECPEVHLFERELAEQWGLVPEGHPWLKPVRFHASQRAGHDAWGRDTGLRPRAGVMDFFRVEGDEVHEVAVGPIHAGVIEPGHFRFQCHGELVMHLEISLGYQHRGVERAMVGGAAKRAPFLMETVAGDSSVGHATAYCQAIEALAGCHVPSRALAIRSIALELERLANHVGDLGALAGDVGFLPTSAYCGRLRGEFLNMTALLCGSRFGRGLVRPGGVAFDLEPERVTELLRRLDPAERDVKSAVDLLWAAPSVQGRFEGTGEVPVDVARQLGLVGLAARACGVDRDVRRDLPAGMYQFAQIPVSTWHSGDVFARAHVRWLEIERSIVFVRERLARLPKGTIRAACGPVKPQRFTVSLVEGFRGEICHVAETDDLGRLAAYKIVDPSFHNWIGLAMALRGQQISDFPLCNKSFNLSYCGHDL